MYGFYEPPKKIVYEDPFAKRNISIEKGEKTAIKLFNELATQAYVYYMEDQASKSVKDGNAWAIYYIIIVGAEETGKSETIDFLCSKFVEKYSNKTTSRSKVWTSVTSKYKDHLYDSIAEGKNFLFIAGEDLTGKKDINEEESKRRRHKAKHLTGCEAGMIFDITCVHDILAVNKLWRDASTIIISKSAKTKATSPHGAVHQQYFVNKSSVKFLDGIDEYRNIIKKQETQKEVELAMIKFGHYYGYGAIWTKLNNSVKLWYNPKVEIPNNQERATEFKRSDYLYDLEYKRQYKLESEEIAIEHTWTDLDVFKWHEPIYKAMKTSTKIIVKPPKPERVCDYAEYFNLLIMQQLSPDSYKVEQLLGTKSTVNRQKKNALNGQRGNNGWRENKGIKEDKDKKRHPIAGWIINKRGEELFEDYVLFVLEELKGEGEINVNFSHKPKIIIPGYRIQGGTSVPPKVYVDDLIFYLDPEDKENSIVINLKCGKGKDPYQWGSFKTTHFATTVGYQAVVLYYDVETDLCLIFEKEVYEKSNIAVSGEKTINQGMTLTDALKTLANRLNPSSPAVFPLSDTPLDHALLENGQEKDLENDPAITEKKVTHTIDDWVKGADQSEDSSDSFPVEKEGG